MADWQQHLQSVFFGVVFSFLLAKLFSVIFAFGDGNLPITRSHTPEPEPGVVGENEPLIDEDVRSGNRIAAEINDHSHSDDDWEGVESTELDETFSAATAFVAAKAADRAAVKASNEVQLQLYGLYKIATEGPCSAPQPSALKMTARAKWQAWQKLGAMPPEEAMQKYIDIVTELYPSWAAGSSTVRIESFFILVSLVVDTQFSNIVVFGLLWHLWQKKREKESSDASVSGSKGPMGPVFSTFVYEEPGSETKLDSIHLFAQGGDEESLIKCIDNGVPLNLKDGEGRTPLHWAVDRGRMNITALLLNKNADVNAKDNEGQTALHYAAICERAAIAELLVKHGGDREIEDNDGNTPSDLCEVNWPWMQRIANASS